ncbi:MAG: hypothetical protein Q8L47_04480 [bacterium]|nr:hypothetical protein [bacterium]
METKPAVVAFAFGTGHTQANPCIGLIAAEKAVSLRFKRSFSDSLLEVTVYSQPDLSNHIWEVTPQSIIAEKPGKPSPTLRISMWVVERAVEDGVTDLWIAAASPHLPRCERDLRWAIRHAGADIRVHICEKIEEKSYEFWFDPASTQARTQTREAWEKRETLVMQLPFSIYRLVSLVG